MVRHGQARFGAADYDGLSDLGVRQARALGAHLAALGWLPDRVICGTLARQRQTVAAMLEAMRESTAHQGTDLPGGGTQGTRPPTPKAGSSPGGESAPGGSEPFEQNFNIAPKIHEGFDEYDFDDMLTHAFPDGLPEGVGRDRRAHFRTLRAVLAQWQRGELAGVRERWTDFIARVEAARQAAIAPGARRVLAVSSGGVMGRLAQAALAAPEAAMIALNMQIANTGLVRFFFNDRTFHLNAFNATPHLDRPERVAMLTYA